MTPTIDDRLASIVRALTEVILPHLPPEASLAQEQAHLAIGHLQIIRAQAALGQAIATADGSDVRGQRQAVHLAVDALIKAAAQDGDGAGRQALAATILAHEAPRALKDRKWFAPFGFDTL